MSLVSYGFGITLKGRLWSKLCPFEKCRAGGNCDAEKNTVELFNLTWPCSSLFFYVVFCGFGYFYCFDDLIIFMGLFYVCPLNFMFIG